MVAAVFTNKSKIMTVGCILHVGQKIITSLAKEVLYAMALALKTKFSELANNVKKMLDKIPGIKNFR